MTIYNYAYFEKLRKEIAKAVEEIANLEVGHANIFLTHPIKALGVYEVMIALHADVTCNVLINVGRSESEAKDAISQYRSASAEEAKESAEETTPEGGEAA